jgi:CRP-like cAMP-binding protein
MAPPTELHTAEQNRLLATLPHSEYERLLPDLEPVVLHQKQSLTEPDEPIRYVYFLRQAVASILAYMEDGTAVEGATVGREGLIGLPTLMGDGMATEVAICQVPGSSARITSGALVAIAPLCPTLVQAVQRYTLALMGQMVRTAGCNRVHPVEERCARWLLMTADRVGASEFPLTQEFLAAMLGVRRPSVSVAAGMLQQAGLITYKWGRIRILNCEGLEQAACEDYRLTRQIYDRLYSQLGEPRIESAAGKVCPGSKRDGEN